MGGDRAEISRVQVERLLPEANNRLTVVADGPAIQVYVNGLSALTAQDETYQSGLVGLAISLAGANETGDVRATFDDFRVVSLR